MKVKKSFYLLLPAACILSITSFSQTSSGKLLLAKGQKIQIDNNVKTVSSQDMMGQAVEITLDANLIHEVVVKDKKANSYLLTSTLIKLSTFGSAMGQELKFDSDKKEDLESENGKALKDQLNVTKELELDESAKVIMGVKKDTGAIAGGQLMDMINNVSFGNDESNGANAAFEVMPAGKKVGDSWSDSSITEGMKTYRNYTFKEADGNNATILLAGKQLTKKKLDLQGMEVNINLEATLSGEGIVDMRTGLLKQRTMVMEGTSTTEVMGQSIPGTTKVTTTTTVKTI
ncbi:MAG: DUF6263 family protein [Ferruginibacter sp.]